MYYYRNSGDNLIPGLNFFTVADICAAVNSTFADIRARPHATLTYVSLLVITPSNLAQW